jgi:glyoxylase-like metal-dependent hydrolase (beta-lactamase superfamily II)
MAVHQYQIWTFKNFVYLVESRGQALVVDPQKDCTPWEKTLAETNSELCGVLLTHTHWDHVLGLATVVEKYNVPVYVHQGDAHRLGKEPEFVRAKLRSVTDSEILNLGDYQIEVMHTPGHSAGEVCYLIKDTVDSREPWRLLTGDTVFVHDVGRCDLETGSVAEMFATLQRLKKLPPQTIVLPGHDYGPTPTSTIGNEIAHSASFKCRTVEELNAVE